jgi:hypothetical protein
MIWAPDADPGSGGGPAEFECPVCFALTQEPDRHNQWHQLHAQNLQTLIDAVNRLKPPATGHRR